MPHIGVKMIGERSEELKRQLAEALSKAMQETLGVSENWITVSVESFTRQEWQDVFATDIAANEGIVIKPQYDPKSLL